MATPHITAKESEIANIVIMPGDPKRAQFIANHYLTNVVQVNEVRGMTAYTGYYKDKKITVFPSGMGIPSMGIYAYELFHFYHVDTIIRVGTCGSYKEDLNLFDIVLIDKSYSESNFAKTYLGLDTHVAMGDEDLNRKIQDVASTMNQKIQLGNIYCSECFYSLRKQESKLIKDYDCVGVEMESYALFNVAKSFNKKASTVLTVSDSIVKGESTTPEEREKGFHNMILLVLESIF